MLKALSPITFEKFYQWFVWTATESAWQEHLIKISMISKETWQTISYGISIESTAKFTKSGFSVKALLFFKLHIRLSGTFVNLKEQFDNMSYRLSLLRLQLSNLIATVTHQKCTIISNFDFDRLSVELGPYGSFFFFFFFVETNSKNNCHVRNWLVFNRNETILYAIHQHSEKHIDMDCKVTLGFKYIRFTLLRTALVSYRVINIIIITLFHEDNIFGIYASLTDGWYHIIHMHCK